MHCLLKTSAILMVLTVSLCGCRTSPATAPVSEGSHPASNEPGMYLQLIERMQQQGAWYASLAHVQAYRQQYGDSPQLQLAEADALRNTGQSEQAAERYRGLTRSAHQAAAWHGLGMLAIAAGQQQQAIEHLLKATALSPLQAGYLGDLGYARLLAGQLDQARAPLTQAAELSPGDGRAAANLALWHMLDGRPERAEQMMRQAGLPDSSQQAVRDTARRLRTSAIAPPATAPAGQQASAPAQAPPQHAMTSAQADMSAAEGTTPPIRPPVTMLERFSVPSLSQPGSQP